MWLRNTQPDVSFLPTRVFGNGTKLIHVVSADTHVGIGVMFVILNLIKCGDANRGDAAAMNVNICGLSAECFCWN